MNKQIGWYKEVDDKFFCDTCFSQIENLSKDNYKPVYGDDLNNNIYTCDKCGKEEGNNKEKKWERWNKASDLRRVFMYHPGVPILVRIIALFLLFLFIGGLIITVLGLSTMDFQRNQVEGFDLLLFPVLLISILITSYGLSRLKRWSLYLFGISLICIFIEIKNGYFSLNFGLIWLIGFIILLSYYKKFIY